MELLRKCVYTVNSVINKWVNGAKHAWDLYVPSNQKQVRIFSSFAGEPADFQDLEAAPSMYRCQRTREGIQDRIERMDKVVFSPFVNAYVGTSVLTGFSRSLLLNAGHVEGKSIFKAGCFGFPCFLLISFLLFTHVWSLFCSINVLSFHARNKWELSPNTALRNVGRCFIESVILTRAGMKLCSCQLVECLCNLVTVTIKLYPWGFTYTFQCYCWQGRKHFPVFVLFCWIHYFLKLSYGTRQLWLVSALSTPQSQLSKLRLFIRLSTQPNMCSLHSG